MEAKYLILALVSLLGSTMTFFSGFGLGTLLLPVFSLFYSLELAIAMTGIVHLTNNIFKISLFIKNIDFKVALKFGLPAIIFAFLGAKLLIFLGGYNTVLYHYTINGKEFQIKFLKLVISILIFLFALIDLLPNLFDRLKFNENSLYFGGVLSGFFGGLSGHQGALRSAFLINVIKDKSQFIATGVAIAILIDITRISNYIFSFKIQSDYLLSLIISIGAALIGVFLGNKLFKKATIGFIQILVSIFLILIAIFLGSGIL